MTQVKRNHWKKLTNPDYIGAYDFDEKEERTLTIKSVANETVTGPDGKKDTCIVIRWAEPQKPMICNNTNAKMISKVLGTPYIEEWIGKRVTLFVQSGIKAFGAVVDAIRIKDANPNTQPIKVRIQLESDKYTELLTYLKANPDKLKDAEKKYDIEQTAYEQIIYELQQDI
jgi:hypothetical protein